MKSGSVVRVRGLQYRYPNGVTALDSVDFDLAEGEQVAILGPNGSGKTTFVLCVAGLLQGFEGSVDICGERFRHESRRQIGVVFQDADDQLVMPTVLEDVMLGLTARGIGAGEARTAATKALEQVRLRGLADRAPWELSGGEKRRAALAGALVLSPALLILDEPTVGLDPPGRRDVIELLARLPQARMLVTHDAALAKATATRGVFFDRGRIVAEGSVTEILHKFDWER